MTGEGTIASAVEAMAEVLEEGGRSSDERPMELRMGDLPDCNGGKEMPVAEVSCQEEAGQKVYSVRDNRAGFDMRRAQKLFCAFLRAG